MKEKGEEEGGKVGYRLVSEKEEKEDKGEVEGGKAQVTRRHDIKLKGRY